MPRLSKSFHETFKPERQYINSILRFAALGLAGDLVAIADETGIPMGKSSGKVAPTLAYAQLMGLITVEKIKKTGERKPRLTSFGRILYREDPFLQLGVSQWISHLSMCNPNFGAELWFQVFYQAPKILGGTFSRSKLDDYLAGAVGNVSQRYLSPVLGMYSESASFTECMAIDDSGDFLQLNSMPTSEEFENGYAAWLLTQIESFFAKKSQVAVTDLDDVSGVKLLTGWDGPTFSDMLERIERKGFIKVDRLMDPWLIHPSQPAEFAWKTIYDDLI